MTSDPGRHSIDQQLNRANSAWAAGRLAEAESTFRALIRSNAEHPEAYHLLGLLMAQTGRPEQAGKLLEHATQLAPARTDILINCAALCQHRGDLENAARHLEQAQALGAPQPELPFNLGVVYQGLGRYLAAASAFAAAAYRRGSWPEAKMSAGNCLLIAGETQQACALLSEANAKFPGHAPLASNLLMAMNYADDISCEALRDAHVAWAASVSTPLAIRSSGHTKPARRAKHAGTAHRRIGFVSPNLCDHAVAFFLEPLISKLPHHQFETFAYTSSASADSVSAGLRTHFTGWRIAHQMSDEQLVKLIRDDRIDVLIDLAGHTGHNRLPMMARRPAPLQISMIGYPSTTGLSAIDYCVTDAILDPIGEKGAAYVETLARLPLFCCYQPPRESVQTNSLPMLINGYPTAGSFQSLAKLSDTTLASWAQLCSAVPRLRLIVQATGLTDHDARDRLRTRLENFGIAPIRVDFRPPTDFSGFLRTHHEVDICLDTLPWNGHTTTCHALWMGVPTLTQTGNRRAGRMGSALLRAVGLPQFITESPAEFATRGAALLEAPEKLATVRAELRQNIERSVLCNAEEYTRHFIQFLETARQR